MQSKTKYRIFLSVFFFLSGFCFSSWTSRIPTIKALLDLNDAQLGTLLLTMPFSSLLGLPLSGWLISRFNSRIPLTGAFLLNALSVLFIAFASTKIAIAAAIGLFAFSLRISNISINTQALTIQKLYGRKINGSFHGIWSTGGIAGIAFTTLMVALNISIRNHLAGVAAFSVITTFICYRFLITDDVATSGNKIKLGKPDPFILSLGLIVFFCAYCEGGMFDWSGVYFRDVVKEDIFTSGYLIFMICMASSRFASDILIEKAGIGKTYALCSVFIVSGIAVALFYPQFWPAMIGFSLVGLGTGSVIPLTYSLAGTSPKYSPGMAISIIATYGIAGFLSGPPLIGYLSHAFSLRLSFLSILIAGIMLIPFSQLFLKIRSK